jgi:glucose-1-phosphate thymidylyltransferase
MKALILSGGKGTRLYPLTYTQAKQLIPVANQPVLFRVIEDIRDAGVTEVGIIVGQNAAEIQAAVGDGAQFNVSVTYVQQASPDGLAHAVKTAYDQGFLKQGDRFVMFLGDNVIQGGIAQLIGQFAKGDYNSQIVLKAVDNPSAFGVAKLREDGSIEALIEKPENPPSNLALVGVYMFDDHIREAVYSIGKSRRGEYEITDAIQWLITNNYRVLPYVHQGWWIDTGKPMDMLEANSLVLDERLTKTPQDRRISASAVIENATVDHRVIVEEGAQIINSTVRGPAIIGKNAKIKNSFVGAYTSIYYETELENCEIDRSIVLEKAKIINPQVRIIDSLIGRFAKVSSSADKRPKGLRMNLGDHSTIWTD